MSTEPEQEHLQRLADAVKQRRVDLRLSQEEMQARGGPSTTKMSQIEAAKPPYPRGATQRRLEQALGWAAGSVDKVIAGGVPEFVRASEPASNISPHAVYMMGRFSRQSRADRDAALDPPTDLSDAYAKAQFLNREIADLRAVRLDVDQALAICSRGLARLEAGIEQEIEQERERELAQPMAARRTPSTSRYAADQADMDRAGEESQEDR